MADITITAANVRGPSEQRYVRTGTAGEAITAGTLLYLKSSDQKYWLADADASEEAATIAGMALTGADADGPVVFADGGDVDIGGTIVKGRVYVLSDTGGGLICPEADLASGDYCSIFGVASSTSNITIDINNSGVTV